MIIAFHANEYYCRLVKMENLILFLWKIIQKIKKKYYYKNI